MVADVRYSCEQVSKPISSYLGGILNGMCFSDHSTGYFVAFPQHIFIDALPPSTKSSAFSKEEEEQEQEEAWAIFLPRNQENLGRCRLPWIFQPPQTRTYGETNSSILAPATPITSNQLTLPLHMYGLQGIWCRYEVQMPNMWIRSAWLLCTRSSCSTQPSLSSQASARILHQTR